jgi:hypothetical protein
VVEHAVKGERRLCFLVCSRFAGQETCLVEGVQLEGIDFLLQFRRKLSLEVAQAGFAGEITLKSCALPQGLAIRWMEQDAQDLVTGKIPFPPVEAQQVHAQGVKGYLPLGRGPVHVGGQEGFQGTVVEEPDADFKGGEGFNGLLVQITRPQVAVGRPVARFRRWG